MSENWFIKHAEGWTYSPNLKKIRDGERGKRKILSARTYKKLKNGEKKGGTNNK